MAFPAAPTESGGAKLHFLDTDDNVAAGWFGVTEGSTATGTNTVGFAGIATHVHDDAAAAPGGLNTSGSDVPIVLVGGVRDDALSALTPAQGDAVYLLVDQYGALWTHDNALSAALSGSELQVDIVGVTPDLMLGTDFSAVFGSGSVVSGTPAVKVEQQGSVTADTELPAAAALGDAVANPTAPAVGAFLMGYDGTDWERLRVTNTGQLHVEVQGSLPAGTNAIGKLAANDGVDIGDVGINNSAGNAVYVRPGTSITWDVSDRAARDLGKVDVAAFDVALPAGANLIGQVDINSVTPDLMLGTDFSTVFGSASVVDGSNHLQVDIAADSVGIGGGTQYDVDDALGATPTGTLALATRDDSLGGLTPIEGDAVELRVDADGALWVHLLPLPAGTNNIGDVDVATVPAPLNVTGGGTESAALRVTIANDSTGVVSVDDNGNSLTVDNAALTELGDAINASRVDVNVAATGLDLMLGTDFSTVFGTVSLVDGSNHLQVDIAADSVGIGGGYQYQEDTAHGSGEYGTMALVVRNDAGTPLAADGDYIPLMVNSAGALYVTGGGGGTEYTDDTSTHSSGSSVGGLLMAAATPTDPSVDANDIGAVAMSLDRRLHVDAQIVGADAALDVSAATVPVSNAGLTELAAAINTNRLDVNVDAATLDLMLGSDFSAVFGSASVVDGSNHLQVDIAADSVGIGGGTQYTDDTDTHSSGSSIGTLLLAAATPTDGSVDANDLGAVAMSLDRRLHVDADITAADIDLMLGTDFSAVFGAASVVAGNELQVDVVGALPAGDNNIGNVDIVTVPAPLNVTGGGTESAALRVTIANDSTGLVSVDDGDGSLTVDNAGLTELAAAINTNRVDVNVDAATLDLMLGTDFSAVFGSGSVVSATPAVKVEEQGTVTVDLGANNDVVVEGDVAHDSPDSGGGGPVKIGGYAYGGTPTAVAAGDRVNAYFDEYGRQVITGGVDDDFLYADINDATSGDNTIIAAAGAGKRIAVWSVLLVSDGTVDVRFEDGAAGTAFTGQIPLQAREGFAYSAGGMVPLWKGTANTLLNLELSAAINVHGHVSYTILDD